MKQKFKTHWNEEMKNKTFFSLNILVLFDVRMIYQYEQDKSNTRLPYTVVYSKRQLTSHQMMSNQTLMDHLMARHTKNDRKIINRLEDQ